MQINKIRELVHPRRRNPVDVNAENIMYLYDSLLRKGNHLCVQFSFSHPTAAPAARARR